MKTIICFFASLGNYTKLEAELNVNNFITSFEFLEENNDFGSESYLLSDVKYNFNEGNSITYNTRRNRKTDLTEYYNLIYEYKNDCLTASIRYNKEYYSSSTKKPNEELFFNITLIPLGSTQTKSIID